jgi:endoglucanase
VGFNPVVGDWNGDGKVTIGVFDSGGNWLLRNSNSAGPPDITPFHYGLLNWTPVSGNWGPPAATPTAAPSARAAEAVDPGLAPLSAEALGLSGADLDLLASSPATARRNQENTSG